LIINQLIKKRKEKKRKEKKRKEKKRKENILQICFICMVA
jgi:hypothetical protein